MGKGIASALNTDDAVSMAKASPYVWLLSAHPTITSSSLVACLLHSVTWCLAYQYVVYYILGPNNR